MALSERGKLWARPDDGMLLWTVVKDLWHPQTNPNGYASLGIAENTLMHDTLSKHIKAKLDPPNHAFTYGDGPRGTDRLRSAVSRFLTKHLKPLKTIEPSQIAITNGVTVGTSTGRKARSDLRLVYATSRLIEIDADPSAYV